MLSTTPSSIGPQLYELEQLLPLVSPDDAFRGMFFNGVLEAAKSLGGETIRAQCVAVTNESKFVDFFRYPATDFLKMIYKVADSLGPTLGGREAVFFQLGRRATDVFLQSTVGRTMIALAGKEPQRLLSNIPSAYKAAASYGDRSLEWLGPQHARLMVKRSFLPIPYEEGTLSSAMERSSARGVVVKGRRASLLDAVYDIRWD